MERAIQNVGWKRLETDGKSMKARVRVKTSVTIQRFDCCISCVMLVPVVRFAD